MSRFQLAGVLVAAIVLQASAAAERTSEPPPWDPADAWEFSPPEDPFTDDAIVDLRSLNERRAGQHGFIRLSSSGDSFVDGRGEPIRFWAVGSEVYRLSPRDMDRHCRFLAKLGVNLVRLHVTVADVREGAAITAVDRKVIDGVFRFIKAANENGIYLIISPYYGHHETPRSWKLPGYSETGKQPWGALFIDPRMQEAYKHWTREFYAQVNPHTGLAIKDDPTVAILQIVNEDSLFFWTAQALPPPLVEQLRDRFAAWLAERYGSVAAAFEAWGDAAHPDDDDDDRRRPGLLSIYELTLDHAGATTRRARDQVEFLAQLQRSFYAEMGRYLREELGCQQLLNASNWRTANDDRLKALERWTYAALDVDAENEYYGSDYQHVGENNGYRIDPGHFLVDESCLHKPLELTANYVTGAGRPFIVTETSWKRPNLYQSEGPFLISAYQSLGGVDAVCWFVATRPTWLEDPRKLFWPVGDSHALEKWSCSTPMLMGMFPAAALSFRRGDLQPGPVVAHERRRLSSLFEREIPKLDDHELRGVNRQLEELKSPTRADGRPTRALFLMGAVTTELFDGDESAVDQLEFSAEKTASLLDPAAGAVRSATGQINWNYRTGLCTVDSPRTQGVAGFLRKAGGRIELSDVAIECENHYASISVVSLDGAPLGSSKQVLVQVGTVERLTGWRTEPHEIEFESQQIAGERIVNAGRPPLLIARAHLRLTVDNPALTECVVLDAGGYRRDEFALQPKEGAVVVPFPPDALSVVLRASDDEAPAAQ